MSKKKQIVESTDWLTRGYSAEELARMKAEAIKEAEAELREKQIKEMAELIAFNYDCTYAFAEGMAEFLHDEGYRKQSEGEWKDRYENKYANHYYECSVCGKPALNRTVDNGLGNPQQEQALSPYCPHCGAKMKGGAE